MTLENWELLILIVYAGLSPFLMRYFYMRGQFAYSRMLAEIRETKAHTQGWRQPYAGNQELIDRYDRVTGYGLGNTSDYSSLSDG